MHYSLQLFCSPLSIAGKKVTGTTETHLHTIYTLNAWLSFATSVEVLLVEDIQLMITTSNTNHVINTGTIYNAIGATPGDPRLYAVERSGTPETPAYATYTAIFTLEVNIGGVSTYTPVSEFLTVSFDGNTIDVYATTYQQ